MMKLSAIVGVCATIVLMQSANVEAFGVTTVVKSPRQSFSSVGVRQSRPLKMASDDKDNQFSISSPLDRPLLAVVDTVSLVAFAGIGYAAHAPPGSLDIVAILKTALPFVIAWLATSPLTGVYSLDNKENNIQSGLVTTLKGWIIAVPLGIVGRGLIRGVTPPVPFIVVTLISTLVIVGGARLMFSIVGNLVAEKVN